ncbi:MAG: hypothetical protein ABI705_04510 [Aestuariivirga sp.]
MNEDKVQETWIAMAEEILELTPCSECDGTGSIPHQVSEEEWEAQQCQTCHQVRFPVERAILAAFNIVHAQGFDRGKITGGVEGRVEMDRKLREKLDKEIWQLAKLNLGSCSCHISPPCFKCQQGSEEFVAGYNEGLSDACAIILPLEATNEL